MPSAARASTTSPLWAKAPPRALDLAVPARLWDLTEQLTDSVYDEAFPRSGQL